LGNIGAGNHFAEIQVMEDLRVEAQGACSLCEDDVVLLVHSGSRVYGGDILKRYSSDLKPSLRDDDPKATDFWAEQAKACDWAKAN